MARKHVRQTSNTFEKNSLIFIIISDDRLRAWSFNPTNPAYLAELKRMGIQVDVEQSGFVKMLYTAQTVNHFLPNLN